MEPILSDQDRDLLDRLIKDAEKRTKAQIVAAVVKRSDCYAELPWKAFAFGASVTGLLVGVFGVIAYCMSPDLTFPLTGVAAVLVVGALFALLTVLVPGFARLFLSAHRAEAESGNMPNPFSLKGNSSPPREGRASSFSSASLSAVSCSCRTKGLAID